MKIALRALRWHGRKAEVPTAARAAGRVVDPVATIAGIVATVPAAATTTAVRRGLGIARRRESSRFARSPGPETSW